MKSSKDSANSKKGNKSKDPVTAEKIRTNKPDFTHEEVREKANDIYLQRLERGENGTAENDWIEAENFLRNSVD